MNGAEGGQAPPARRGALVLVSPHLDDAVLSCAQVIRRHPGSTVVTVFAGRPDDGRWSRWDRTCFRPGQDPMTERQAEDRRALVALGATAVHLPFLDAGYEGPAYRPEEVAEVLGEALERLDVDRVLVPMGLWHPDHEMTHVAATRLFDDHRDWIVYEELPYRLEFRQLVRARKDELAANGYRLATVRLPRSPDPMRKLVAIRRYRSQLPALGTARTLRALRPERYWRVARVTAAPPQRPNPPG